MCEACDSNDDSWRGWLDIPSSEVAGKGPWSDLSHPISGYMPGLSGEHAPDIKRSKSMPKDPFNVTTFQMGAHTGTHIDAPVHLIHDGPTIDQIPLDRLSGGAVVWRVGGEPFHVVTPTELERLQPRMQPGDIVIFDTGWWENTNSAEYTSSHTSLSVDAAEWLVRRGAKLVAVDCRSPEAPKKARGEGWRWPVHRVLLSHGVLVAEHLRNLHHLAGHRVEVVFQGLNLAGADGAPARVLGRIAD